MSVKDKFHDVDPSDMEEKDDDAKSTLALIHEAWDQAVHVYVADDMTLVEQARLLQEALMVLGNLINVYKTPSPMLWGKIKKDRALTEDIAESLVYAGAVSVDWRFFLGSKYHLDSIRIEQTILNEKESKSWEET